MAFLGLGGSFFYVLFIRFFSFFTIFLLFQGIIASLWLVRKNFLRNIRYQNNRFKKLFSLHMEKQKFEKEFVFQRMAKANQICICHKDWFHGFGCIDCGLIWTNYAFIQKSYFWRHSKLNLVKSHFMWPLGRMKSPMQTHKFHLYGHQKLGY